MFTIALDGGHGLYTAGKRCDKIVDPKETREWVLNNRICNYIQKYLKDYNGYKLYRVDDTTGKIDVALKDRVKTANSKGADLYLSIHHNAAKYFLKKGGGIEAYCYTSGSSISFTWRDAFYDSLIKYTDLVGNRSTPKTTAGFYVIKYTNMPAVLLELGYMNSAVDTPIILTEEYAQKCAKAIVEVIVKRGKLTKKAIPSTNSSDGTVKYRVQVGAYKVKNNAINLQNKLKKLGYNSIIVTERNSDGSIVYKVQVGAYINKNNAINLQNELKKLGYKSIIKTV